MRLTRIVPLLLVAACAGCGGGGGTPGGTEPGKEKEGKPGGTPAAANLKDTEAGAKKFAADFLAAVRDRKATPDQLTPEFRKAFSDSPAAELVFLAGEVGADDVTAVAAAEGVGLAVGKNKAGGRTLVRAVKVGGEWKADWLSVGPKGVNDATLTGDDAPAQFAAQAFLDAALRKKPTQASAVLTDAARTRLGASTFDATKFDAGKLGTTLGGLVGDADRYTLTKTTKEGGAVVVTAELASAAGKKAATLKAVKGTRPGEWLIDAVEVK